MSDFLSTLAARTLGVTPVVVPRRRARFECEQTGHAFEEQADVAESLPSSSTPRSATTAPAPSPVREEHNFGPSAPQPVDRIQDARSSTPAAIDLPNQPPIAEPTVTTPPQNDSAAPAAAGPRVISVSAVRQAQSSRDRPSPSAATRREPAIPRRPEAAPAIHITIGRVEVRAIHRAESTAPGRTSPESPRLSLGSYLRGRRG